jgi:hypothetical protein
LPRRRRLPKRRRRPPKRRRSRTTILATVGELSPATQPTGWPDCFETTRKSRQESLPVGSKLFRGTELRPGSLAFPSQSLGTRLSDHPTRSHARQGVVFVVNCPRSGDRGYRVNLSTVVCPKSFRPDSAVVSQHGASGLGQPRHALEGTVATC